MLWDNKFLYVAFDNADSDVWAKPQQARRQAVDPGGGRDDDRRRRQRAKTYVELQVAPNGNLFDTYLPERRKYEDTIDPKLKPYSWNSKMNAKVHVDGTLNKREDQDKGWTVEIAIPLEDVKGLDDKSTVKLPPTPGDVWRVNMFRMDVPQGKPQQAAGWSPPMVGDFHALDKFGELVFGDAKGVVPPPPPPPVAPALAKERSGGASGAPVSAPADRKAPAAKTGGCAGKKRNCAAEWSEGFLPRPAQRGEGRGEGPPGRAAACLWRRVPRRGRVCVDVRVYDGDDVYAHVTSTPASASA